MVGTFRGGGDDGYDLLDFVDQSLTIFFDKMPTGFFVEVVDRSDEVVVSGSTDLIEEAIRHEI